MHGGLLGFFRLFWGFKSYHYGKIMQATNIANLALVKGDYLFLSSKEQRFYSNDCMLYNNLYY